MKYLILLLVILLSILGYKNYLLTNKNSEMSETNKTLNDALLSTVSTSLFVKSLNNDENIRIGLIHRIGTQAEFKLTAIYYVLNNDNLSYAKQKFIKLLKTIPRYGKWNIRRFEINQNMKQTGYSIYTIDLIKNFGI